MTRRPTTRTESGEGGPRVKLALGSAAVRAAEEAAVSAGASHGDLMERAGAALAAETASIAPEGRILVVTGKGGNGGDGWVAARRLVEGGRDARVFALAPPASLTGAASAAAGAALESGVRWSTGAADALVLELAEASAVVDAVFGVGLRDAPDPAFADAIDAMDDADAPVVSADVPSGVDADTGAVPGVAVHADVTVTFGFPKPGLLLFPGAGHAGELVVADIGVEEPEELTGALEVWDWSDLAFLMPWPAAADHKGTRGAVLVVGGAPGMTGAVCLAASGALRAGAGYVTAAVPAPSLAVVECTLTTPVKTGLPAGPDGALDASATARVLELAQRAQAVVVGPGLGRSDGTRACVRALVREIDRPLVLDADALWALTGEMGSLRDRRAPAVLTPHAGEAASLLGLTREAVEADRPAAARALSGGSVVAVLKGARTLVSDGERVVVTMTGGPGLATMGTGDVLAGIVGALLAQGLGPLEAAALAAHLHGAAGDAASGALTPVCCTAEDVLTYLPEAVRALVG
jgi:hydroxyethylthiazole kinase-like uncharacterized protein yjeF